MNISKPFLVVAGLCIAAAIILFNRDTRHYLDEDIPQTNYIEYTSVLWKAHVYGDEIRFLSDDRVIHTTRFEYGDKHIYSVSYRNLHGYFDPVFVTVWKRGHTYQALIIDPAREQYLFRIETDSEIDISVSPNNKILISYERPSQQNTSQTEDHMVTWPF